MFVQYCYERTKVQFNCEINIASDFRNKKFLIYCCPIKVYFYTDKI